VCVLQPGVGKTALSRHLTAAYGLVPLSSGVLMRSEIARGTELGQQIKGKVESGGLVEDELVLALVEKEIARLSSSNATFTGVILDGFPRTLKQAHMLDKPDCPIPPIKAMMSEQHTHMHASMHMRRRRMQKPHGALSHCYVPLCAVAAVRCLLPATCT